MLFAHPKSRISLIDKSGKVIEMQIDSDAIDPTKIVTLCERRKAEK